MKFNIDNEDFCIDENKKINDKELYNSSLFYGEVDNNNIYNIIVNNIIKYEKYEDWYF